jgi:hypothetical protein
LKKFCIVTQECQRLQKHIFSDKSDLKNDTNLGLVVALKKIFFLDGSFLKDSFCNYPTF